MLAPLITLLLNSLCFTLRMSSSGSFPKPLTAEQEREYLTLAASGDEMAKSRLIEHNLRLVAHIVKKYYSSTMDSDDLVSIGTIGLMKAVSTFDASRGARLATYAARCIENEILMHFRSLRRQVPEMSLSDPLDGDPDGGDLSIIDVISDDECMIDQIDSDENIRRLNECIDAVLTDRERLIIRMRYGLGDSIPKTQREIASICGISRSYVSRIEKKALEKLRTQLEK